MSDITMIITKYIKDNLKFQRNFKLNIILYFCFILIIYYY